MDFINHLSSYLNENEIEQLLASLSNESKHAALINNRKMSDNEFVSLFPNVIPHPIVKHAFIYDKNEYDLGKSIYHELGCFYLQEPSAMLVSYLLNPNKNDLVLDLCAAPGGKSVQASFLMENDGLIISNDLSFQRAKIIVNNIERLGIGNLIVTSNDFSKIYQNYNNYFEKIILDAPCSGSGMFRKSDLMKQDWTYQKVLKNQEIQKELIKIAYFMLKPGGILAYSTCSFSKEEDEDVVKTLLDDTDAELADIPQSDLFFVNKSLPLGIHLLPSIFPGEGHYICLIKKPGEIIYKEYKNNNFYHKKVNVFSTYSILNLYGDTYFLANKEINIKGLSILRNGVKLGELFPDGIKYDYHYSRFINEFNPLVELNDELTHKYFLGESLNIPNYKGYVAVSYHNKIIDIAKGDGRIIKNRLPKGLRKRL